MLATGISNVGIDKLYRCLFTTTVGFYHQIQEVVINKATPPNSEIFTILDRLLSGQPVEA